MKLRAQKWEIPKKCLFFVFLCLKCVNDCKSANNETKMFLAYLGHGFVFVSKQLDSLMGILRKKVFAFTVVDTFALAR